MRMGGSFLLTKNITPKKDVHLAKNESAVLLLFEQQFSISDRMRIEFKKGKFSEVKLFRPYPYHLCLAGTTSKISVSYLGKSNTPIPIRIFCGNLYELQVFALSFVMEHCYVQIIPKSVAGFAFSIGNPETYCIHFKFSKGNMLEIRKEGRLSLGDVISFKVSNELKEILEKTYFRAEEISRTNENKKLLHDENALIEIMRFDYPSPSSALLTEVVKK